jgi:DNA-binding transcriptional LysR family regulator
VSELDRLIRFSVVAEELSFSRAARRLHVDQPWLSRQIQQLELQLGFALFVRSTRKVALTSEGEQLFCHTKELVRVADECRQASREMSRTRNLELAIGVYPFSFWIPERKELLDTFSARHPRVSLDISSNNRARLLSRLRKRLIDFALIPPPFKFPDLEAIVLHSSPTTLLVPAEDPLAAEGTIAMERLAGRTIPTFNPELSPEGYERYYGPLFAAGAVPYVVPEGHAAIPHYAAQQRLPVLCFHQDYRRAHGALADFVELSIEKDAPRVEYALVRRREPARAILEHFWSTAETISGSVDLAEKIAVIAHMGAATAACESNRAMAFQ